MTECGRAVFIPGSRPHLLAGLVSGLVLLGACSVVGPGFSTSDQAGPKPAAPAPAVTNGNAQNSKVRNSETTHPKGAPAEIDAVSPPRKPDAGSAPREGPKSVAITKEQLVGLNPNKVLAMLGSPQQVREDKAATIWSWLTPKCELDLYFYMDMGTRTLHSLTYDLRPAEKPESETALQTCIDTIRGVPRGSVQP